MDAIARAMLAVAAVALAACGREEAKPVDPGAKVEQAAKAIGQGTRAGDMAQVGEGMKQMGEALSGSVQVEPVDFRKLKELLPESIAAMRRVSSEGSRTSVVGVASSKAEAVYEDGKGGRITCEFTDVGTFTAVTALAFAWVNIEIDRDGDSGYERTVTTAGRKAYERYARASRTGELDMIVAGRFLVHLEATGVERKAFQEAVARLDLARLEALRLQGVPAAPAGGGKPAK